jgi:hypothetical protein
LDPRVETKSDKYVRQILERYEKGKKAWTPPTLDKLAYGQVVAIDQSLTATGIVALLHDTSGLSVKYSTVVGTGPTDQGGYEDSLQRAMKMELMLEGVFGNFDGYWRFVHEAPPVGGGKIMRPEASLLSAMAVRSALRNKGKNDVDPMIRAQDHKKFVCGNGNADKKTHHKELMEMMVSFSLRDAHQITNEAKRDALSIGLFYLHRRWKRP